MAKVSLRVIDQGDYEAGLHGFNYLIPCPIEVSNIYKVSESEREKLNDFEEEIGVIYSVFSSGRYDSYFVLEDVVTFRLDSNITW